MNVRIQSKERINSVAKKVSKQKYYQYYCEDCDNDKTGWTSTESDTESLKLK